MVNSKSEVRSLRRIITIDGPSASGKSTIARMVAQRLKYTFVESGSLYRAVTWVMIEDGLDVKDTRAVVAHLAKVDIGFSVEKRVATVIVNGVAPGDKLRGNIIDENVSIIALIPEVRAKVVSCLRGMTKHGDLVVEGRDIGTVVFPDADAKFFLDASPEERARRRNLQSNGATSSVDKVRKSLVRRDEIDTKRKCAPLRPAEDAVVVDSTGMTIEQVVDSIMHKLRAGG